jgi:hypothetical protein
MNGVRKIVAESRRKRERIEVRNKVLFVTL